MKSINKKKKFILNNVFFLKGLAIILIIFVHYGQLFNFDGFLNFFPQFGQMGCQIFLILSCFTLTISYKNNKPSYILFLKKRFSKIYLSYYIMIFIFCCIRVLTLKSSIGLKNAINPVGILLNILFLHGLIPNLEINNKIVYGGWFIGTIVIFYIIFPFLFKLYEKSKNKYLFIIYISCFCFLIMFIISYYFDYPVLNNSFLYFSFINQLPCFILGFILYYLYSNKLFNKIKFLFLKMLIFLFISIVVFYSNLSFSYICLPFIFGIFFIYFYIFCIHYLKKLNKRFKNILFNFGKYSFSIFLTQSVIIFFIFPFYVIPFCIKYLQISNLLLFFILIPVCYILCFYVGKYFDIIINRLKILFYLR